ncbi:MAG: tRNA epoxyqueuosine(34) reductase QueG [Gammaproteobacteria bacterium]
MHSKLMTKTFSRQKLADLAHKIKHWGHDLGFQQLGIAGTDLAQAEQHLQAWLEQGFHGDMEYMQRHGLKRSRPELLEPGTLRVISARMDYLPETREQIHAALDEPIMAYISRYALGRDYHKLLRKRLQQLAERIEKAVGPFGYRVFTDSAPVLEKALAEKAGLGWIGKHSNLINRKAGSWFFLGEIYTDLPLPIDRSATAHCGACRACLEACPTQAIIAPYQVDARRCVSYLSIELHGPIPAEFRPLLGNRIYGCDDCQLVCPWNRFAQLSSEADFMPRHELNTPQLLHVFAWDEAEFLRKTEGSAIRRIGWQRWQRNVAVALGNAPAAMEIIQALEKRLPEAQELVAEHIRWALAVQRNKLNASH